MVSTSASSGLAVVQSPDDAEVDTMPKAALQAAKVDFVLPLAAIGQFLANLYKE